MGLKSALFHSSAIASNTVGGLWKTSKGKMVSVYKLDDNTQNNTKYKATVKICCCFAAAASPCPLTYLQNNTISSSCCDLVLELVRKRHFTLSWIKHIIGRRYGINPCQLHPLPPLKCETLVILAPFLSIQLAAIRLCL